MTDRTKGWLILIGTFLFVVWFLTSIVVYIKNSIEEKGTEQIEIKEYISNMSEQEYKNFVEEIK